MVYSYHHNNTLKIAETMSKILKADIRKPDEVSYEDLQQYDMIGFGAGIDSGKHYKPILTFAEMLPKVSQKKTFIFSTSAIISESKIKNDHSALREILNEKGYIVLDEFSCKGYNTNKFLKYFGGMNRGRPNSDDHKSAEDFAKRILDM